MKPDPRVGGSVGGQLGLPPHTSFKPDTILPSLCQDEALNPGSEGEDAHLVFNFKVASVSTTNPRLCVCDHSERLLEMKTS